VVGENLGNVPREIFEALPRHRIWGMYLAEFEAGGHHAMTGPGATDMALIGTHDTPPLAGWLKGTDIGERVHHKLLAPEAEETVRKERARAARRLAKALGRSVEEPDALLAELLTWLGGSESPLVVPWLEDLWLEHEGVNLPGTRSSDRPNWQRPMRLLLEEIFGDPEIKARVETLARARRPAR
jgi:4-alpha-glucanotransferase